MVTMADLAGDRAVDPDAQAAVTDFLDYTEYLPSDLMRSLTLIRGLDEAYLENTSTLHDLTKIYGSLPSIPPAARPDPQKLRSQISTSLDHALNARGSAYAEACRLFDVVDRHQNRLKSIIAKLNAIPKPPSRDPSPQAPSSAQAKRSRSARKLENGTSTRLTLIPPRANTVASAILKRPRGRRRVTVPGEVMPPFDPDSPIASTEVSDWDSPPPSPPRPILKFKQPKAPAPAPQPKAKPATVTEKPRAVRDTAEPYHKPTPPPEDAPMGSKYKPWTHLTEYEMYRLRKKMKKNHTWEPSDVMIRRELSERGRGWENYYRAKAEAEANGTTFIDIDSVEKSNPKVEKPNKPGKVHKVETVEKPHKVETAEKAAKVTESTQEPESEKSESVSVPSVAPTTSLTPGPKPKVAKKVDQKKEKKADPARSKAALAAQEAELAARRLGDIGSKFRNLFTTPFASALSSLSRSASSPSTNRTATVAKKTAEKQPKKRKADETTTPSASPSTEPDPAKKKQKIAPKPSPLAASPAPMPVSASSSASEPPVASAGVIKIPLKLTVSTPTATSSKTSTPGPTARAASVQRQSIAPKTESTPPVPSRPPSRRSGAASVEPQQARTSRRASMTPSVAGQTTSAAEHSPKSTAASRRSKRDAPGTVMQSSQDGGAAVSVSKRKTKPGKQQKPTAKPTTLSSDGTEQEADSSALQIRVDVDGRQEIVDPDEDRYCICGDVSWGEMICCELEEKVRSRPPSLFQPLRITCPHHRFFAYVRILTCAS